MSLLYNTTIEDLLLRMAMLEGQIEVLRDSQKAQDFLNDVSPIEPYPDQVHYAFGFHIYGQESANKGKVKIYPGYINWHDPDGGTINGLSVVTDITCVSSQWNIVYAQWAIPPTALGVPTIQVSSNASYATALDAVNDADAFLRVLLYAFWRDSGTRVWLGSYTGRDGVGGTLNKPGVFHQGNIDIIPIAAT